MGRWVLLGAVAAVALVTGMVVTGLPDSVPSDVVRSDISPPRTTTTLPPTTARTTTTTAPTSSTAPATTPPPSTAPRRTATPTTAPPTTTRPPSATKPRTTRRLTPAASVRVVIANAGEADDLAARTAPVMRGLGYENLVISTASTRQSTTVLWFRRGMEEEARALARKLGMAAELVRARPRGQVTAGREQGDVWLLIGRNRPPRIDAAMG